MKKEDKKEEKKKKEKGRQVAAVDGSWASGSLGESWAILL
jgi:hypothetical protein